LRVGVGGRASTAGGWRGVGGGDAKDSFGGSAKESPLRTGGAAANEFAVAAAAGACSLAGESRADGAGEASGVERSMLVEESVAASEVAGVVAEELSVMPRLAAIWTGAQGIVSDGSSLVGISEECDAPLGHR
jgi:hypothetical protein